MGLPWEPTKGPKAKKLAEARWHHLKAQMDGDDLGYQTLKHKVPDEWWTLEMDYICDAPKEKVTLYLDRPVARMFRAMGKGYQGRINRILELWLQMQIAVTWHEEKDMTIWAYETREAMTRGDYDGGSMAEHEKRLVDDVMWMRGFEAGKKAGA